AANSSRNFESKSGTRIIDLLVPLCFRSSCQRVLQRITNFGSGALGIYRQRRHRRPFTREARIPAAFRLPSRRAASYMTASDHNREKPSMSKSIVVSIPHRLGRKEAVSRMKSGLERARTGFGGAFTVLEENWTGDHL